MDCDRVIITIGNDLTVGRLGYGNRQLTGPGIWGEPRDREGALQLLRTAVDLGVQFIDTADAYGPAVAEALTAEALYPYPPTLVIATKAGMVRTGPDQWHPLGRPEYLRQQCELSLRNLRLETIDLYQLHRLDPAVAFEDQIGLLADLRREGKVRNVGLSEVSVPEVVRASEVVPIVSVQNRYSLLDRVADPMVDFCERHGIAFIPWFPLAKGLLTQGTGALGAVAQRLGATASQVALAWLLARSPRMLPIPGTASIAHLQENVGAAAVTLSPADIADLRELRAEASS